MKKLILIIFLIIMALKVNSQHILSTNLVPNPSFEDYLYCPTYCSQIESAFPWKSAREPLGSTDYLNLCTSDPSLLFYLQKTNPKTGNGCGGIFVMDHPILYENYREYLAVKLKIKLINKKKYCSSFFTILPTLFNGIAIENLGIFFSKVYINTYNPQMPGKYLLDSIPQVVNKKGIILDTVNWTNISGIYEAKGDEEFITIGNFNDDSHTNWLQDGNNLGVSYYLIDDVSVCECSFDINLGEDTTLCEGETIILNPNLPNATYTWQDSSHTATYEVKQPGTYWVRAYVADYDVYSSDTIVITQGDDSFCNPPLTIPNVITPNGDGANDNFVIQNAESYTITLQIYNRWGRLIYENTNYQNDFSCKTCAAGVYYYVLKAKSKRNGREKEYKGSLTIVNG